MHITTSDLRNLLSHNVSIHHELLILSLEVLCKQYNSSYLDPSFYTELYNNGWHSIENRFSSLQQQTITRPALLTPTICIPVHVHGCHWVALCRRIINSTVTFYYADYLIQATTESQIKRIIQNIPQLYPSNSNWISCSNLTYLPHSNECGRCTVLALAIMMASLNPHATMLQPYMNSNLAQQARTWMGGLLLTGQATLLAEQSQLPIPPITSAQSVPQDLILWLPDNQGTTQPSNSAEFDNNNDTTPPRLTVTNPHPKQLPNNQTNTTPRPIDAPTNTTLASTSSLNLANRRRPPQRRTTAKTMLKKPTQLTLFDTKILSPHDPSSDDTWGHQLSQIDPTITLRIIL
jgi:hypothetical protein